MKKYYISVNPLAEFAVATNAAKRRIIKQQLTPNKLLIPWYQLAKSALKRYFADINVYTPLQEAIRTLNEKVPENKRQEIDKKVSIEVLNKVTTIEKPKIFSKLNYRLIKASEKNIAINEVEIRVAPDLIIKGSYRGNTVYGAIKFHICKTKPFDLNQAMIVSTLLYQFTKKHLAKNDDIVLPELCLCFDVFGERFVPAPKDIAKQLSAIKELCEDIKQIWPKAA